MLVKCNVKEMFTLNEFSVAKKQRESTTRAKFAKTKKKVPALIMFKLLCTASYTISLCSKLFSGVSAEIFLPSRCHRKSVPYLSKTINAESFCLL